MKRILSSVIILREINPFFELAPTEHHDHIICEDCGKVFEFTDNIIEQRQREISEKYGIKLKTHNVYLYGKCSDINHCDENNSK